jgi:hypothetical protein
MKIILTLLIALIVSSTLSAEDTKTTRNHYRKDLISHSHSSNSKSLKSNQKSEVNKLKRLVRHGRVLTTRRLIF